MEGKVPKDILENDRETWFLRNGPINEALQLKETKDSQIEYFVGKNNFEEVHKAEIIKNEQNPNLAISKNAVPQLHDNGLKKPIKFFKGTI